MECSCLRAPTYHRLLLLLSTGTMRELSQHSIEHIKTFLLDPVRCPTTWPTLLALRHS